MEPVVNRPRIPSSLAWELYSIGKLCTLVVKSPRSLVRVAVAPISSVEFLRPPVETKISQSLSRSNSVCRTPKVSQLLAHIEQQGFSAMGEGDYLYTVTGTGYSEHTNYILAEAM
jgi:hypothetical protein